MSDFNDFTSHGYEVIKELGANHGAGRVAYLSRQIDSKHLVVIKQFQFAKSGSTWDGHKAIDREVKILKQLQHPNIPRYLSSFETEQSSCIVQEYIEGQSLSEIISNQQLYTPEQVKEIILKLLEVLVYLQTTFTDPLLHRDIKPANILIDSFCEPYLIDFGGAKVSEGVGGSTVSGTLGFMPPEQRYLQFNKTTDIYGLGLTIVCWLTRTEPTNMYNIINMGTNQVMGLRELLSAYSLRFVDWLEKVVQPDPKDRYPDAEAAFNAFKPLYVKRVPEASFSSSILEIEASKLGERLIQTLIVSNNIPETVLEGWWEVAPHPSDPPHTPNFHEWISFESRKFSGNFNECSIIIHTEKLMAAKIYERQILLHSNSSEEVGKLDLIIRTAKIPIQADQLPYNNLIQLLLIIGVITIFTSVYMKEFISIAMFILADISLIVICITLLSTGRRESIIIGCGGLIASMLFASTVFPYFSKDSYNIVLSFLFTLLVLFPGFRLIPGMMNKPRSYDEDLLVWIAILSMIFSGISIPLVLVFWLEFHILFLFPLLLSPVPMISVFLYPTIKQNKLVDKYRSSESRLIKP